MSNISVTWQAGKYWKVNTVNKHRKVNTTTMRMIWQEVNDAAGWTDIKSLMPIYPVHISPWWIRICIIYGNKGAPICPVHTWVHGDQGFSPVYRKSHRQYPPCLALEMMNAIWCFSHLNQLVCTDTHPILRAITSRLGEVFIINLTYLERDEPRFERVPSRPGPRHKVFGSDPGTPNRRFYLLWNVTVIVTVTMND